EFADSATRNRYDRLRSISINANLAEDYTLGEALTFLRGVVAEQLGNQPGIAYGGQSREFVESSDALLLTFLISLLLVYLVLAAQFESFVQPVVILLTVPLAVFGGLLGLKLGGGTINIYSQIGMVILIGLAAKNGILIVEFANQMRDQGRHWRDAVLDASVLRLRPILMTGLSTSLGALPLVLASGAGAEGRAAIGLVVLYGVTIATLTTLLVVPGTYGLVARFTGSPHERTKELDAQLARGGPSSSTSQEPAPVTAHLQDSSGMSTT
ncbi:MAG: efflux RND transporter permease subunit, partial [Planctomycetota bacterium]|nr:efflux RND transporter permease subunit [Planctomycetota bacterium]